MPTKKKKSTKVPLSWKEVYFTNCPMVSANNIDQELQWCKTDFKQIGIDYDYFRSRRETNFYPHYIHNQDNLSLQNLACVKIGKDFMLEHGYIKNDFDVNEAAAPEFLEQAAKALLEERWQKVTAAKLPEATSLRLG